MTEVLPLPYAVIDCKCGHAYVRHNNKSAACARCRLPSLGQGITIDGDRRWGLKEAKRLARMIRIHGPLSGVGPDELDRAKPEAGRVAL